MPCRRVFIVLGDPLGYLEGVRLLGFLGEKKDYIVNNK